MAKSNDVRTRLLEPAAKSKSLGVIGYPNEEFPVVREGAMCLLCQQMLTESAVQRLGRFEQFIKDDAAKRSDEAAIALRKASKDVAELKLNVFADDPALLEEVTAFDPTLVPCYARRQIPRLATGNIDSGEHERIVLALISILVNGFHASHEVE